ncbi:MAG: DUF3426 domain-containing protein [Gammaproteobacteria bacterium]|nr:DUF3426 domain-containing protein [Gammaproteobacteria bacterium]
MYTRCPSCQTLFRIRADQLKAADGRVRCCRCNQVFNALEHLRDFSFQNSLTDLEAPHGESLTDEHFPFGESPDSGPSFSAGDDPLDDDTEAFFASEPGDDSPDYTSPLITEDEPGFSLEDDGIEGTEQEPEFGALLDEDDLPAANPDFTTHPRNAPPVEPVTREHQQRASGEPAPSSREYSDSPPEELLSAWVPPPASSGSTAGILGWSSGIILLVFTALVQAAWLEQNRLQAYPGLWNFLEGVCEYTGCRLEPRRAPHQFKILNRSIASHPTADQALQVLLTFRNQADFPQPHPMLQLSLYSSNNQLVARRVFSPEQYLSQGASEYPLIDSNGVIEVTMALTDPGAAVTGFRFEFY